MGDYDVVFTFLGSDDLLFSGHLQNQGETYEHQMQENFLFLETAEESDLFTTMSGGTVQVS